MASEEGTKSDELDLGVHRTGKGQHSMYPPTNPKYMWSCLKVKKAAEVAKKEKGSMEKPTHDRIGCTRTKIYWDCTY